MKYRLDMELLSFVNSTELLVQDLTGRVIQKLKLNKQEKEVSLQLSHYSSGIYTYTLIVDGQPVATKKMVVIK